MQQLDRDLLLSVSNGLGTWTQDRSRYVKQEDCLGCLKDLQRFLRNDDPDTRDAFFKVGEFDLARNDLVPLITTYPDEKDIVFNALKVLTFLTMPLDPTSEHPQRQAELQRRVKEEFLKPDAVAVVVALVADPLSHLPRMSDSDHSTVQLVLTFLRNLLHVPDAVASRATAMGDHKTKLQEGLLHNLFSESVMELLQLVLMHANEKPFRDELSLLLHLLSDVFNGVDASHLASAEDLRSSVRPSAAVPSAQPGNGSGKGDGSKPVAKPLHTAASNPVAMKALERMKAALAADKQRHTAALASGPARHARFTGTFVRRHGDQTSTILHNNSKGSGLAALKAPVAHTPRAQIDAPPPPVLSPGLLLKLRCWSDELLEDGGYNVFMEAARRVLEPGLGISRMEEHDFIRFLGVAQLFTSFVRLKQTAVNEAKVAGEAKKAADAKKAASAKQGPSTEKTIGEVAAATAADADASVASPFAGISSSMGWDTFHMVQTLWVSQIDVPVRSEQKSWDILHYSTALLKEMLLLLDLAERSGSRDDRTAADRLQRRLLHDDMKESGLMPVLSRLVKNFKPTYQPRSHAADLMQAMHVVLRMYDRLSSVEVGGFIVRRKAAAKQRRKQAPGPVGEANGNDGTEGKKEGMETDKDGGEGTSEGKKKGDKEGGKDGGEDGDMSRGGGGRERDKDPMEEYNESESDDSEDDEGGGGSRHREVVVDLDKRQRQELATPSLIHFYCSQLAFYATNTAPTNAAIFAVLNRIVSKDKLDLEPMLYNLSVLRIFHKMLSDRSLRQKDRLPQYSDLLSLATKVTKGLFSSLCPAIEKKAVPATVAVAVAAAVPVADDLDLLADDGEKTQDPPKDNAEADDASKKKAAAAAEACKKKEETEEKVRDSISSMLFIDLMFWKSAIVAEEVNAGYFLKLAADGALHKATEAPRGLSEGRGKRTNGRDLDLGEDMMDEDGGGHGNGEDSGDKQGNGGDGKASRGGRRDLANEIKLLRKLHLRQNKASRRTTIFNGEGVALLHEAFEKHNSTRHNIDLVIRCLGDSYAGLGPDVIMKELKAMGLRFGYLTESQESKLQKLWATYRDDSDCMLMIASEMSGGWTSKDIKRLLKKHGLKKSRDGSDGGDSGQEKETFDLDVKQLKALWAEHEGKDDAVQQVTDALNEGSVHLIPNKAVLHRLCKLGLVKKGASKSHKVKLLLGELRALYDEHKDDDDALNMISAKLTGNFSVKQVQRLLLKHHFVEPDANAVSKKARLAEERVQLCTAYKKYRDDENYLELMAAEMGNGAVAQEIMKMLKKHRLVEVKSKKRRNGDKGGIQKKARAGEEMDEEDGVGRGRVPEPNSSSVLALLQTIQDAHDGRWCSAVEAVEWILRKLDAAEKLRSITNPPYKDFSLVMHGPEDESFFMTDKAQELLEAAGIRDDKGDFYKIPGYGDGAWVARVRSTLKSALENLDSDEAREQQRCLGERAAAAAAAGALVAGPSVAGAPGPSGAGRGGAARPPQKQRKQQQRRRASLESNQDGSSDDDEDSSEGDKGRGKGKAKNGSSKLAKRRSSAVRRGAADTEDADSGSASDSSSSGSSSSSDSGSGSDDDDGDQDGGDAMPHFSSDVDSEAGGSDGEDNGKNGDGLDSRKDSEEMEDVAKVGRKKSGLQKPASASVPQNRAKKVDPSDDVRKDAGKSKKLKLGEESKKSKSGDKEKDRKELAAKRLEALAQVRRRMEQRSALREDKSGRLENRLDEPSPAAASPVSGRANSPPKRQRKLQRVADKENSEMAGVEVSLEDELADF